MVKQSIVNWHPWPENGVEGLPENETLLIKRNDGHLFSTMAKHVSMNLFWIEGPGIHVSESALKTISHYALASDLETVNEIDGDKCGILPRAMIDRARATKPTIEESSMVQNEDEDRVRWLVEQACILSASGGISEPHDAIDKVLSFELDAVRQVKEERERKEGGHELVLPVYTARADRDGHGQRTHTRKNEGRSQCPESPRRNAGKGGQS